MLECSPPPLDWLCLAGMQICRRAFVVPGQWHRALSATLSRTTFQQTGKSQQSRSADMLGGLAAYDPLTPLRRSSIEITGVSETVLKVIQPGWNAHRREVAAWQQWRNFATFSVDWRFTTTDACIKLKCLYPSLQE